MELLSKLCNFVSEKAISYIFTYEARKRFPSLPTIKARKAYAKHLLESATSTRIIYSPTLHSALEAVNRFLDRYEKWENELIDMTSRLPIAVGSLRENSRNSYF